MSFRNEFEQARDFLILHRADYDYAHSHFKWPKLDEFNWALDYFDPMAAQNDHLALWVVDEKGRDQKYSFAQMSERSNQTANFLRRKGLRKGDSVLLFLDQEVALWECLLACMKIGAVMIPLNPKLSASEIQDHLVRENIKGIVASRRYVDSFALSQEGPVAICVDEQMHRPVPEGWISYSQCRDESVLLEFSDSEKTKGRDPLVRYFVASTTAKPKLVEHSHVSFPVGHLSTMYWMGLHPGDIHYGVSSLGGAMHDWNQFIAPWNAEASILVRQQDKFDAKVALQTLVQYKVTTFCAPPTVWRLMQKEHFNYYQVHLREALSMGEPLGEEIISDVYKAWGVFVREGYGQTEISTVIGVPPEEKGSFGTLGKPLPGYDIALRDAQGEEADEGEICIRLHNKPLGVMSGLGSDQEYYVTGDQAYMDYSGNFVFESRCDGMFKSSDCRISPVELESILKEHPAIADAVVIPSVDSLRGHVPKALVSLTKGLEPHRQLALDIMNFSKLRLAPFKRIRRIEFTEVPKNAEGVIPRAELIAKEKNQREKEQRGTYEFWEEDTKIVLPSSWAQELP